MKKYHMRKKDREITDENELNEILLQGKYVTIAMCRNNEPYIVTLSYGYDKTKNALYMHTGLKGLKIDILSYNSNVCATIIDDNGYVMGECAHKYRTIVIEGNVDFVDSIEEKKHGMGVLLRHLEENPMEIKERTLKNENIYNNVMILRLDIKNIVGKKGQ